MDLELNVYYQDTIYTTHLKRNTKIKHSDIILNINNKDKNLILLDSNGFVLQDNEFLQFNEPKKSVYLVNLEKCNNEILNPSKKIEDNIEELVMKVTGSNKILPKKANLKNDGLDFLSQLAAHEPNIESFLSVIQNLGSSRFSNNEDINDFPEEDINENNINNNNNNSIHIEDNIELSQEKINQLIEMGFDEAKSRDALRRANNDVDRAIELLCTE